MLKITRKVEYALIALNHFQRQDKNKLTSAREMSNAYGIPAELLAKVLQKLAREEIIAGKKGPTGGYRLSVDPQSVKMTEFFEMIEGPVALMDCYFDSSCNHLKSCTIREPLIKINDAMRTMFDNMTLADITN